MYRQVIGAPLAASLLALDGFCGLAGWQWLFLVEGFPTILLGIWINRSLAHSPSTAPFLTPAEKTWLLARHESQKVGPLQGMDSHHPGHLARHFHALCMTAMHMSGFLQATTWYSRRCGVPSASWFARHARAAERRRSVICGAQGPFLICSGSRCIVQRNCSCHICARPGGSSSWPHCSPGWSQHIIGSASPTDGVPHPSCMKATGSRGPFSLWQYSSSCSLPAGFHYRRKRSKCVKQSYSQKHVLLSNIPWP